MVSTKAPLGGTAWVQAQAPGPGCSVAHSLYSGDSGTHNPSAPGCTTEPTGPGFLPPSQPCGEPCPACPPPAQPRRKPPALIYSRKSWTVPKAARSCAHTHACPGQGLHLVPRAQSTAPSRDLGPHLPRRRKRTHVLTCGLVHTQAHYFSQLHMCARPCTYRHTTPPAAASQPLSPYKASLCKAEAPEMAPQSPGPRAAGPMGLPRALPGHLGWAEGHPCPQMTRLGTGSTRPVYPAVLICPPPSPKVTKGGESMPRPEAHFPMPARFFLAPRLQGRPTTPTPSFSLSSPEGRSPTVATQRIPGP